jgi:hypothetical protein
MHLYIINLGTGEQFSSVGKKLLIIRARIRGFDDQKLKGKNTAEIFLNLFLYQKQQFNRPP